MMTIPFHFEFDKRKFQQTEGIIKTEKSYFSQYEGEGYDNDKFKQWLRQGRGQLAEYNVYRVLELLFKDRQCLLVGGFEEKKLLEILVERHKTSRRKQTSNLDIKLTEDVSVSLIDDLK